MKEALLKHSKEELADRVLELEAKLVRIAELEKMAARVPGLEFELAQLKRQIFGAKTERFVSLPAEQYVLDLNLEPTPPPTEPETEQVTYIRQKKKRKERPARGFLPADLPRITEIIRPDCNLEGAVKIGEVVTEFLECNPLEFWVRRVVREKFAWPREEEKGVAIAELPSRPIDKAIAGASVLAMVLTDKYVDHLPLYRLQRRFRRAGVNLPTSTLCDWVAKCCELLEPLYEVLKQKLLESGYIQGDESPLKVLERCKIPDRKNKKKKDERVHLGYQWVYQSPEKRLVLFDYRQTRSQKGPVEMLQHFIGFLQTDGYKGYDAFGTERYPEIILLRCMVHARRKFFEAKDFDKVLAEEALAIFSDLYDIEREAREKGMSHQERYALRQEKALPVLATLKTWLTENLVKGGHTPQSPIVKAIKYTLGQWDQLCVYTTDGRLEIDNNLVENSVRPLALGRKNYLFAGSHKGAQRAAMMYSFLGTCKLNNVEPLAWLKDVLKRIKEHPVKQLEELLPGNWTAPAKDLN